MMTHVQALAFFLTEVTRASVQLSVPMPQVAIVEAHQRNPLAPSNAVAYLTPQFPYLGSKHREIVLVSRYLFIFGDNKPMLRCVARHEVAHIALGHNFNLTAWERDRSEGQVDELLKRLWNEPKQCSHRGVRYESQPQRAKAGKPSPVRLRTHQGFPLR